jgi:recombinational DNA repair ATPase RecF
MMWFAWCATVFNISMAVFCAWRFRKAAKEINKARREAQEAAEHVTTLKVLNDEFVEAGEENDAVRAAAISLVFDHIAAKHGVIPSNPPARLLVRVAGK